MLPVQLTRPGGSPCPALREAAKQNGSPTAAPDAGGPSAGRARPRSSPPPAPKQPAGSAPPGPAPRARGRRPVRLSGAGQGRGSHHRGRRRKSRSAFRPHWRRPPALMKKLGQAAPAAPGRHSPSRHRQRPRAAPTPPRLPSRGEGSRAGALPGRRAPHQSPGGRLAPLGADWLPEAEVGGPGGRRGGSHILPGCAFQTPTVRARRLAARPAARAGRCGDRWPARGFLGVRRSEVSVPELGRQLPTSAAADERGARWVVGAPYCLPHPLPELGGARLPPAPGSAGGSTPRRGGACEES